MTKKLTRNDYHLRMVRYLRSRGTGVAYSPPEKSYMRVFVLYEDRDDYFVSNIVLEPQLVIRRYSDERMAEEILFKTPLAKLYEKLIRGEVTWNKWKQE